ncbi:MAG: tetratricopeptide repeat protein [Saprospiraceae bacterium]|nr:tetratricopeptide repeat protein [Saprospiraceae bacterium]
MRPILLFLLLTWSVLCLAQPTGSSLKKLGNAGGKTWAVVVGISDYQDKDIPDLRFAHKDAEAFALWLQSPAGGSLDGDQLQVLINDKATAGRVAEALDALLERVQENDKVFIYFSGHGDVERKTLSQPGFLLCWDAPARVYMGGGTYSLAYLQEVVATLSLQNKAKVTVIADACRAGKLAGSQIGGPQLTSANLQRQQANEMKILSCQSQEYSLEGTQWGGGRGVFSYHLMDGLYGLADRNEDGVVTLGELDRYLEDHVTAQAAPISQVPVLLGNKTDGIAVTHEKTLADLNRIKSGERAYMSATDSRGLEDEVLAKIDSGIVKQYLAFKEAVIEKRFFSDPMSVNAEPSADELYTSLLKEPGLSPLYGAMTRNFAAALQDDAQQAMNIWLAADVQQLECIGKTLRLNPIPRQLARAAELLGAGHYMYSSMQARMLLFQGILRINLSMRDDALGRECLSLFRQSLEWEKQSSLPWHWMSQVYIDMLRQPDSAFVCARQAQNLAPNWVLPFVDLGYALIHQRKVDLAYQALKEAEAIDSLHPYVINRWATWFNLQGGKANQEKAAALFEKYLKSGGVLYPCWYNDYGAVLQKLERYSESETKYKEAISLDPNNYSAWNNLGNLYIDTQRFAEAEPPLRKAIEIDSMDATSWGNLGSLFQATRRYTDAESIYKKVIALDSTDVQGWSNLGILYLKTLQYSEAEAVFKKAIALDSTQAKVWYNLGCLYRDTYRHPEAEAVYKRAIKLDSSLVRHWSELGIIYLRSRRFTEAVPILINALALDTTRAISWNLLGAAYNMTLRYAEAEPILKKAIALDSTSLTSWHNLGYLYKQTQRFKEAELIYKKMIAIDSTDVQGWSNLGNSYLDVHRYAEAESVLKKAITLDSLFPHAHRHLGMVYFKTNRLEEARRQFLKTIELSPNAQLARLGLAAISYTEGKTAEAIGYVAQAIEKGVTFDDLNKDEDLAPLRALPQWEDLMKKHFPDQFKK